MQTPRTKKNRKLFSKTRTRHLSVRVPENILESIELLVNLGLFKDKSDFINYSLQETLMKYLMNTKIEITPELINRYFETLEQVSPKLSEKESLKLIKEIRKSRRKNSFEETKSSN
ncbi:MAG: hypothetical protein ACP6IU_12710 [Candidatus Asgardarchaeia archaeon]